MAKSLSNKIVLLSGGGRGLGRHVARGLAREGAHVVITARSRDQLIETENLIRSEGGLVTSIPADVGRKDQVADLREQVFSTVGVPSILINAAGTFGPIQLIRDSDADHWIETLLTNTVGPYLLCRAFVGPMINSGWGRIINFSSAATLHTPGPLNSAYGTSKVALNQFTRHLAAELKGSGVTANVIHPGEVQTAMWASIRDAASTAGPLAAPFREWANQVGEQGGDDPQLALDLVLELISEEHGQTSGKFLWIKGGQQCPIPSWN